MELVDGETLAEKTWLRAKSVAGDAAIITVTSRDYYFYTRDDGCVTGYRFCP